MAGKAVSSRKSAQDSKRRLFVFGALAGSLTLTAVFLQLLSPPPVRAEGHNTVLMSEPIERISSRLDPARAWTSIYIHQSDTVYADAQSLTTGELGDHFVICNGAGAGDGDMLISGHWRAQRPAAPPRGARTIDPNCISVCIVGDLDQNPPTPAQMRRLVELVTRLSAVYSIPRSAIFSSDKPGVVGIGQHFPTAEFTQGIRVGK